MKRGWRIGISIVAGIVAVALTAWYGMSVHADAERERAELLASYGGELVNVCVASRDIDAGETLDEGNVHVEEWVAGLVPRDAMTSIDEAIGKQATSAIPERAVLSPVYLQARSGSLEVPEGMVAVSIAVDAAHAVGGSVEPGTEVNVYVSANGIADLLCRAQVIDTSTHEEGSASENLSWATLAVEPERVEELLAAAARGSMTLVAPGEGVELEALAEDGAAAENGAIAEDMAAAEPGEGAKDEPAGETEGAAAATGEDEAPAGEDARESADGDDDEQDGAR